MKFCAEVSYETDSGNVHSDVCFNCKSADDQAVTDAHRKLLHDCLDEWLNKSNGTGAFWIGDPEHFTGWGS